MRAATNGKVIRMIETVPLTRKETALAQGTSLLDVLIVGAGPAGMTLATALARHGIRFRVIDRDDGPTSDTRAPILWQRTEEILATLGIRDLWLPESHPVHEESLHLYGKTAGGIPLQVPKSPYPSALLAPQATTERLLDGHLSAIGAGVDYGLEAVAYREEADHARVTVHGPDGAEEEIRARWVVSAEGAKSVVRHAVGLDYEGEKYVGFRIHTADVLARWTYATPIGQLFFFIEKGSYLGGQRLPGDPDRFYFYILTPDEDPDDDSNEVALADVEALVRRISGDAEATLRDPFYLNTARYKHGLADAYRRGRALLVGDAARTAPPLYGQGMNYAMHDAANLAWKLAHVVKGWGPEALLDSFADERRALGAALDARIDRTFRFITEPKPLQAAAVRAIAPTLLDSDTVKHLVEPSFTEVDLTYAGVGLSEPASKLGKLSAGDRAPALWVKRLPGCTLANLLDLYDGIRWTLLVLGSPGDAEETDALAEYALAKAARHPHQLCAVLLSTGPARPDLPGLDTLVDAEARFVREHDLPTTGLLLVRPDGYLGHLGRRGAADLDAYLDRWLT